MAKRGDKSRGDYIELKRLHYRIMAGNHQVREHTQQYSNPSNAKRAARNRARSLGMRVFKDCRGKEPIWVDVR